ncbi:MAG: hypothetical protein E7679_00970 [Ruminococcaceae bacterium]|nr:hypothetical protein [Oscillospiraceae bacterium]
MSRVTKSFKIAGWLIKFLFTLMVAFVCGFLMWRIFSSGDPKSMKALSVNDSIYSAYEQSDEELYIFRQEQNSTTRADHNAGYFSVTSAVFIPEANQIQVVLRYNNSTIRNLVSDKSLSETPERSDDLFDVSLFFSVDLTPENKEDNATISESGTRTFRCSSTLVGKEETTLYNYRKFVFDLDSVGEDLAELLNTDTLLAVYADVYYVEEMDLDKEAYGTLCLYDYITKKETVKLTRSDRAQIEAWKADD